ncbi:MAG TPA: class I SAM-dependent methyltransferase [Flavisolibacter sp.]
MSTEEFFDLFLIELKANKNLQGYYKFHSDVKSFLFRKAYFCQRLEYIRENIGEINQSIWDCGCGYGTTALFLAMNNYPVFGTTLEFYFAEIEKRKRYWSQFGNTEHFQYTYADVFESDYSSAFDTIILQDTLHHLEPIEEGLKVFEKALREKGKLLVIEENGANIIQNLKLLWQRGLNKNVTVYDERLKRTILLGNENIRSLKKWEKLFQDAGLEIEPSSIRHIRFFLPFFMKDQSMETLTRKEQEIGQKATILKNYFFFGINFKAFKKG